MNDEFKVPRPEALGPPADLMGSTGRSRLLDLIDLPMLSSVPVSPDWFPEFRPAGSGTFRMTRRLAQVEPLTT